MIIDVGGGPTRRNIAFGAAAIRVTNRWNLNRLLPTQRTVPRPCYDDVNDIPECLLHTMLDVGVLFRFRFTTESPSKLARFGVV